MENDNFIIRDGVLEKYVGNESSVTIPAGVTKIGDNAFRECADITEVIFPDSVTEIGEYAFAYCKNLEKFYIPHNVKKIGHFAFAYCTGLKLGFLSKEIGKFYPDSFLECPMCSVQFSHCLTIQDVRLSQKIKENMKANAKVNRNSETAGVSLIAKHIPKIRSKSKKQR